MNETQPQILKPSNKQFRPSKKQLIFWTVGLILGIAFFIFLRNFIACWSLTSLPGIAPGFCANSTPSNPDSPNNDQDGTPGATSTPVVVAPVAELPPPWDGISRVTVLILGVDARDWEAGEGAPRSDTMILLTLDPLTKTAGMLSIPRDLWVNIPGFEYGKINTAYSLGEAYKLPGGGPGLAMLTVEEFLGVPIQYYAQIDFYAFERFIDEIDGIVIEVDETIQLDPLGPKAPVIIEPGTYSFPGYLALAYARDRSSQGGDIDRANRQQEVIIAIRNRLTQPEMLPLIIARAPSLYQELSAGIHTNMPLDDALRLAVLAKDIPISSIERGVIAYDMLQQVNTPQGEALQPIPSDIRVLRDEIFTTGGALGPLAEGDQTTLMQNEQARVAVLNGSTYIGLAGRTSDFLISQGMNVTIVGNYGEYPALVSNANFQGWTAVIDFTGNPYTLRYLNNLMNLNANRIFSSINMASEVDVAIILGDDWGATNPMP